MKTPSKLKSLLAEYNRLTGEQQRHAKMGTDLEAQEAELMKTVNLDNKAEFDKVASIRLRREIVPRKVQEFSAAASNTMDELARECIEFGADLYQETQRKIEALADEIAKVLSPFYGSPFPGTEVEKVNHNAGWFTIWDAKSAADEICLRSVKGSVLWKISSELNNSNFKERRADDKAERLIGMFKQVQSV